MRSNCQGIQSNIPHSFHKVIKVKLGTGVANGIEIQPLGAQPFLCLVLGLQAGWQEHMNYTKNPIQAMRSKSLVWDINVLQGRELHPCEILGHAASSHL